MREMCKFNGAGSMFMEHVVWGGEQCTGIGRDGILSGEYGKVAFLLASARNRRIKYFLIKTETNLSIKKLITIPQLFFDAIIFADNDRFSFRITFILDIQGDWVLMSFSLREENILTPFQTASDPSLSWSMCNVAKFIFFC